jgi:hypothetical protein
MSNESLYQDSVSRLATQSDAIGRLAQDAGGFAAVVAAFESKDPEAFRWVLERLGYLEQCELICEWVRVKFCVLRCFEICPIREKVAIPDLAQFARALVQLASNEKLLRRVVDAVSCGNSADYQAAITELKLNEFCYLICHWVCTIIYRRVCEVVCTPIFVPIPDPVTEIRAAGKAISEVLADEKAFAAIAKAALTLDCEIVQSAIEKAGFRSRCEIICLLICVWRQVWVCRELCVFPTPVLTGVYAVEEARNFALASRQLGSNPRALGDLVNAILTRDAKAYGEIIARFGLGPYCYQICGWVSSVTCYGFCTCICPSPGLLPWFTRVGDFNIYSDIDASGKTNKSLGFGGPHYAFYDCLELRGFCPSFSPTSPGTAMKYRFLYIVGASTGTGIPITGSLVCNVEAGSRFVPWPQNIGGVAGPALVSTFQSVWIMPAPAAADPTPPAIGAPWFGPGNHYISPDSDGWIVVDPNVIGGGFQTLLGFNTIQAVPGGPPLPGVPAGTAVPVGNERAGTDLSITFEATRVTLSPAGTAVPSGAGVDYSNELDKIHINNWVEVNELNFVEFSTGCCTGIDATLSVQFTVDHEEMDFGQWSLVITSCSTSAPGDVTPSPGDPGVTLTGRGGSGTIVLDTGTWDPCSYTATLTTRPALTTGLLDRSNDPNPLTFCICGHKKNRK